MTNWYAQSKKDLTALNLGGAVISLALGFKNRKNVEPEPEIVMPVMETFKTKDELDNNYYPFRAKPKMSFIPLFVKTDFSFSKNLLIVNDIVGATANPLLASIKQLNTLLINISSVKDIYSTFSQYNYSTDEETTIVLNALKTIVANGEYENVPQIIVRIRNKPAIIENKDFRYLLNTDRVRFIIDIPKDSLTEFKPFFVNILEFDFDAITYRNKPVELLQCSKGDLYTIKDSLIKAEDPLNIKEFFIKYRLQSLSLSETLYAYLVDTKSGEHNLLTLPESVLRELLFILDTEPEVKEVISSKFRSVSNVREALLTTLTENLTQPKMSFQKPVLINDYDISSLNNTDLTETKVLSDEELDAIVAATLEDGLWQQFTKLSDEETTIVKNIYKKETSVSPVEAVEVVEPVVEPVEAETALEANVEAVESIVEPTGSIQPTIDEAKVALLMQGSGLSREEVIKLLK